MERDVFEARTRDLQDRLSAAGVDLALITDEDAVYYFAGYHGYLYMDFGRPTILAVWRDGEVAIVTPAMEHEMAGRMSWVDDIRPWRDGVGGEWRDPLGMVIDTLGSGKLGIERHAVPPIVRQFLDRAIEPARLVDIAARVAAIRMIKSPEEIALARDAGKVGEAMMASARQAMAVDVPEYEVALAAMAAGTRKAAELLELRYDDPFMSPNLHFLQTMASGHDTTMPHHRASTKRLKTGEPVFMCFCGMTSFRRFKLGFDRMFWVGDVGHAAHAGVYAVALESQRAALDTIRPGVAAEDVHAAYSAIIQAAGYEFPFRCGRATGFSFLERPQLTFGDKTKLAPGMVLAVDGSVNVPGFFRAQVGDSIVVTDDGFELLTNYPKTIAEMVVA